MKKLKEHEISILILLAVVIFGIWVRFTPVLQANFPINDGGMFYTMINDLHENNFVLPKFTSYNLANIPYAYPPLGFYLSAVIKTVFGVNTIFILTYLPPVLSAVAIFAFFSLAHQLFSGSWQKAVMATTAFALIPRSYSWFIMGGGLTRSLGQIFLLLMLTNLLRLYKNGEAKDIWITGFLGGLVVLSHPEATVHAITAAILFWAFLSHNRKSLLQSLLVAALVLLVSSPWWGTVLWHHGLAPFISAIQTGGHSLTSVTGLLAFTFAEEQLATVVTVLGMIGMLFQLSQNNYFLSIWLLIHFITQPRSATAIAIYPLSLLSAIALTDVIFPALQKSLNEITGEKKTPPLLSKRNILVTIACLIIYLTMASSLYSNNIMQFHLLPSDLEAMQWVKKNTHVDSNFLILSIEKGSMTQYAAEWFPSLSERRSQLTLQGREWTLGESFMSAMQSYEIIQACIHQDLMCIEDRTKTLNIKFSHIFIKKPYAESPEFAEVESVKLLLIDDLNTSPNYQLVYENATAIVFGKTP